MQFNCISGFGRIHYGQMNRPTVTCSTSHSWLDSLAIGMAAICAVHCLLTPLLVALLPIIATSFFVHRDFHLWMLFFVIPSTSLAVFLGCRRHRDIGVVMLSIVGLLCLIGALLYERSASAVDIGGKEEAVHCAHCLAGAETASLPGWGWINLAGGCFLAGAHGRNYWLCRRLKCRH